MAISPKVTYPGQVDETDPTGYPLGKAQNETNPGDDDGTPLEETWVNDLFGFQQALLAEAGLSPSGTPDKVGDSQYVEAIKEIALNTIQDAQVLRYVFSSDATPDLTEELQGATLVRVQMIGGGGRGGEVSPVAGRGGGGGGGSGAIVDLWIPAVNFPANPTITIGQGGVDGSINGTATTITGTGFSLSAPGGLGGSDATGTDGEFGGDGGGQYTTAPAQGQGGAPGSPGSGSAGGSTTAGRVKPGAGGGGGGSNGFAGGAGATSALGFLGGAGGANNQPGEKGRGLGAGGGGQGRADGGGGGGGGGGLGHTVLSSAVVASNSEPGNGHQGSLNLWIVRGNIESP